MSNPVTLTNVKKIVDANSHIVPVIFHSVKMNRLGKEYKKRADTLMTPSSLHQTDKYFKRLFYNKIF
jgi:hypothetical protein